LALTESTKAVRNFFIFVSFLSGSFSGSGYIESAGFFLESSPEQSRQRYGPGNNRWRPGGRADQGIEGSRFLLCPAEFTEAAGPGGKARCERAWRLCPAGTVQGACGGCTTQTETMAPSIDEMCIVTNPP